MICLLGIAGSGKSTQAELLTKALNCPRIYPGELLRQYATGKARQQLEAGELVSDEVTIPLLEQELTRRNAKHKECVMDGSPRSIDQVRWLTNLVENNEVKFTAIIHLVLDKATAIKRLAGRGRADDRSQAVVDQRFKEYADRMGPVLKHLKDHGLKILEVDAGPGIDDVHQAIMAGINAT